MLLSMSSSALQEPPFDAVLADAVIAFSPWLLFVFERNQIRLSQVHQIIFISIAILLSLNIVRVIFSIRVQF